MRGLSQAAALLSSVYVSASIVPRSTLPESASLPDYVIDYGGQKLSSNSDGSRAIGIDSLNAYHFLPNVSCLEDKSLSFNGGSDGRDTIQVAQFGIYNQNKHRTEAAGFTVSFRSSGKPEILRLVPVWTAYADIEANPDVWRTSSITAKQQSLDSEDRGIAHDVQHDKHVEDTVQKSLEAHLGHFQELIGTTYQKARQTFQSWCPARRKLQSTLGTSHTDAPSAVQKTVPTTPTIEGSNPHSLPTRSAAPEPTSSVSISEFSDSTGIKIFGLVLILSSLSIWVFLRLRDPRLQADRAARREERRNKRLYRQAARQHKWKRWFCSWRHRDHRCTPVSTWDEKRARVVEQEEVLEEVMKADIRKLRNHHRSENNISAAEQGRSIYVYDSDDARQRSRETLPGYESEGTQPPSYDTDAEGGVRRVADGFRYIPADREDTPDSSVVSTSPRTSRDDRDTQCRGSYGLRLFYAD
ncbi:MAG: hypothetical protein L6R42_002366 [Xanthoria sp. 1 TBL-2021]|nr:MAG: hypothetical protein L6R42_002366 [Xanthoria sp. 1 TBL-2021]